MGIKRLTKKLEKDLSVKSYIDLTHLIEEGIRVWLGETQPEIKEPMILGKDNCNVQSDPV